MNRQCGAIPVVAGDNRSLEWSYCAMSSCRCILTMATTFTTTYIAGILSRWRRDTPEALGGKVEEIMSQNPLTVTTQDPVLEAASYMGLKNFRRMPVVDKGTLVGMLSIGDINRGLFFEKGMRH